ncbi:hypothetical protein SNL152K_2905 [Streptomyces sp. NL15-2K]|nr:hypothetical protein SNL152K_2905 [Streptomyces sp. NL15-2K]
MFTWAALAGVTWSPAFDVRAEPYYAWYPRGLVERVGYPGPQGPCAVLKYQRVVSKTGGWSDGFRNTRPVP